MQGEWLFSPTISSLAIPTTLLVLSAPNRMSCSLYFSAIWCDTNDWREDDLRMCTQTCLHANYQRSFQRKRYVRLGTYCWTIGHYVRSLSAGIVYLSTDIEREWLDHLPDLWYCQIAISIELIFFKKELVYLCWLWARTGMCITPRWKRRSTRDEQVLYGLLMNKNNSSIYCIFIILL